MGLKQLPRLAYQRALGDAVLTVRRPERYIGELRAAFGAPVEKSAGEPRRFLCGRVGNAAPMLEVEFGAPLPRGRIARCRIQATTSLYAADLDRAATAMRAILVTLGVGPGGALFQGRLYPMLTSPVGGTVVTDYDTAVRQQQMLARLIELQLAVEAASWLAHRLGGEELPRIFDWLQEAAGVTAGTIALASDPKAPLAGAAAVPKVWQHRIAVDIDARSGRQFLIASGGQTLLLPPDTSQLEEADLSPADLLADVPAPDLSLRPDEPACERVTS
jgi:hypothetical protein